MLKPNMFFFTGTKFKQVMNLGSGVRLKHVQMAELGLSTAGHLEV